MKDDVVPAKRIPFAGECFTEARSGHRMKAGKSMG